MDKKYIFNDIAYKISENYVSLDDDRTLLSVMIYNGKLLYLNKQLNPDESNSIIFKTTKEKLNWAESNEFEIWNYFTENELFFNTGDKQRIGRVIEISIQCFRSKHIKRIRVACWINLTA